MNQKPDNSQAARLSRCPRSVKSVVVHVPSMASIGAYNRKTMPATQT